VLATGERVPGAGGSVAILAAAAFMAVARMSPRHSAPVTPLIAVPRITSHARSRTSMENVPISEYGKVTVTALTSPGGPGPAGRAVPGPAGRAL
jgi:hypothetical protein